MRRPAIQYQDFQQECEKVAQLVSDELSQGNKTFDELACHPDCVDLKNGDGVIVYANEAASLLYSPEPSPIGRKASMVMGENLSEIAEVTDRLINSGAVSIDMHYYSRSWDGHPIELITQKRCIKHFGAPGLAVLGVTRLLDGEPGPHINLRVKISELYGRYSKMSDRDQMVCRMIATGASGQEIAESVGMTRRAIELRKRKCFDKLGVNHNAELVKLMVRFQDLGFADLGL